MKRVIKMRFYLIPCLLLLSLLNLSSVGADEIRLKLGTLGPKGTNVTSALETILDLLELVGRNFGHTIKIIPYLGGVMGDDPQMMQKAQMGQLDIITPTVNGLPIISKGLEVSYMAFLIQDYGAFDYVMRNLRYYNDLFYKKGWISWTMITEGMHDLYLSGQYRTQEELKDNLKACNYTGGPDDTFYKALGIPQVPIPPPEMFPSFRAKMSNSVILPSMFVIGMQIYTALPCIVEPTIRSSVSAAVMTRSKWESLPWDLKVFFISMQPMFYYVLNGQLRDGASAFTQAMYRYGSKKVLLTPEEYKSLEKPVLDYRETYLGNDEIKRAYYNKIFKLVNMYKSGNPIEKQIFLRDPTYKDFPQTVRTIGKALRVYLNTGSKKEILELEKKKILERWRLYNWIVACEKFIETGKPKLLKDWMNDYHAKEIIREVYAKHIDTVKKLYGTEAAFKKRIKEMLLLLESEGYRGYQKKKRRRI